MEVCGKFHALDALPLGKEPPVPNECAKVKVKLSVCLTKHHTIKTYRGR